MLELKPKPERFCDFCLDVVPKGKCLVTSSDVIHICEVCVEKSSKLIKDYRKKKPKKVKNEK